MFETNRISAHKSVHLLPMKSDYKILYNANRMHKMWHDLFQPTAVFFCLEFYYQTRSSTLVVQ